MSMKLVVKRRRAERYTIVPNDVVAMLASGELSADAFSALVVMMSRPDGWRWSVPEVMAASGLGKHAWQRARSMLQAVGAVVDDPRRGGDGRLMGSFFEVDWPEAPGAGKLAPGEAVDKSPDREPENRLGRAGKPAPITKNISDVSRRRVRGEAARHVARPSAERDCIVEGAGDVLSPEVEAVELQAPFRSPRSADEVRRHREHVEATMPEAAYWRRRQNA